MIPEEPRTSRLARRIADGDAIDWPSEFGAAETPDERDTVAALRSIAAVSSLHHQCVENERAEDDALAHGASWGPLTIRSEIGRGQFGTVYLAWDPRLERQVALKLLYARQSAPAGMAIREARLLAKVRHANVLTVHGAEDIAGHVGIWTEYIDGPTLEEELAARGPLPPREVVRIGIALCSALAAVHDAGLLHRDVKTQNVMRDGTGRIVLMDFGAGADAVALAARESVAGTPLYLAPELFGGSAPSVRSDIYATGVTLFRLLTASTPVAGATFEEVRLASDRGERASLRDLAPSVPHALAEAIDRAIAASPGDRFDNAREFRDAIARTRLSQDDDTASHVARSVGPIASAVAGAVLLILAGVLVIWLWTVYTGRPVGPNGPATSPTTILVRQILPAIAPDLPSNPSREHPSIVRLDSTIPDLVLTDLDSGETTRLHVKDDGPAGPGLPSQSTLSADATRVAYAWEEGSVSELRVVTIATHEMSTLMRSSDAIVPVQWSDDNRTILVLLIGAGARTRAALVDLDGAPRIIKTFDDRPLSVSLSHDGASMAFDRPSAVDPVRRDIAVASTVDGSERVLIDHPADDLFPVWTPSGGSLVFASTRTGTLSLWIVDVDGARAAGAPRLVKEDIGRMWPLGFSSADTLYFSARSGYVDVYTAALDAASGHVVDTASPIASRLVGTNISPAWSPDGSQLAYVTEVHEGSARQSRALVVRDARTEIERVLTPDLRFFIGPRWSPDAGTILVKGADAAGRWGLHAIEGETGIARPALLETTIGQYTWSDNGAILYAVRGRIMRHRIADGISPRADTLVLDTRSEGVTRIALSRDGRIAYSAIVRENAAAAAVLRAHDNLGERELYRTPLPATVMCEGWSPDGRFVLFSRQSEQTASETAGDSELLRISVPDGDVRSTGLRLEGLREVSLNNDGRHLAFTAGWPSRTLWAIEHLPLRAGEPVTGSRP